MLTQRKARVVTKTPPSPVASSSEEGDKDEDDKDDGLETIRSVFNDLKNGSLPSSGIPLWTTKQAC